MASFNLIINNKPQQVDVDAQMPLLWVIRDFVGLKGTKFGCGISQCGACTVQFSCIGGCR
jgi:isoquinoline 1-oxidoreductase alpha subunit